MTVETGPVVLRCDGCNEPELLYIDHDWRVVKLMGSPHIVGETGFQFPEGWSSDFDGQYCPRCTEENNARAKSDG